MGKPEIVEEECGLCEGCGHIVNDSTQMPWAVWESITKERREKYAAHIGLKVEKLPCPGCKGTGKVQIEVANTHQMAGAV